MNTVPTKSSLSKPRRRLLELCQSVNFGRLEDLQVRGGDPVFTPPPRVITTVKFAGENGPRPERLSADFGLKAQHIELFALLNRLGDGVIVVLEIKHGLPFAGEVLSTAG